jgi:hypothetical protein
MSRSSEMKKVAAKLNALDDELGAAERAGTVSAQVAILRERSRVWQAWADRLLADNREATPAVLAAQRDAISADRLAGGAL